MQTIEEIVATLLTVDGKGREAKREALLELISVIMADSTDRVLLIKEINNYRLPNNK